MNLLITRAAAFCFAAAMFVALRCNAGSCIVTGDTERSSVSSAQSSPAMTKFEYRMRTFSYAALVHPLYIWAPGLFFHFR